MADNFAINGSITKLQCLCVPQKIGSIIIFSFQDISTSISTINSIISRLTDSIQAEFFGQIIERWLPSVAPEFDYLKVNNETSKVIILSRPTFNRLWQIIDFGDFLLQQESMQVEVEVADN